ncbi:hypothetical protein POM88_039491 [Heracleum sosnowskyi]|uniref:Uncharacterized protein n=1 Tax=Heracleum sosnowskyi TaxID=360622 RepID=A0AAD8M6G3_9APIA|nr:hypothetical protein POM88_039491 [Heracleum sosnowskyi]
MRFINLHDGNKPCQPTFTQTRSNLSSTHLDVPRLFSNVKEWPSIAKSDRPLSARASRNPFISQLGRRRCPFFSLDLRMSLKSPYLTIKTESLSPQANITRINQQWQFRYFTQYGGHIFTLRKLCLQTF